MKTLSYLTALIVIAGLVTGCAGIVVGGAATGAAVAHDRRTAGTVVDDQGIEFKIYNAIGANKNLSDNSHINVTSYNLNVLLSGEVGTPALKAEAERIVASTPKVNRVMNHLIVGPNSSLGTRTKDTWITTKVKSSLFSVKMEGFDPSRIKVVTEANTVFLMGLVNRQEGNAAINQARQIAGVHRVVALFEYI